MARLAALRVDVDEARRRFGPSVQGLQLEEDGEAISFTVDGCDYTLLVAGAYPGACQVFSSDLSEELELSGGIAEVIAEVLARRAACAERLDEAKALASVFGEDAASTEQDEGSPSETDDNEEDRSVWQLPTSEDARVARLRADVKAAQRSFGPGAVDFCSTGDSCRIIARVDASAGSAISELTAGAWGIDLREPITLRMVMTVDEYVQDALPKLQIFQGASHEDSRLEPEKQLLLIASNFFRARRARSGQRDAADAAALAQDAAASAASSSSMPYKRRRRAEGFPAPRCPDGETPDVAAARARRDGCVRQALAEEGVVAQTMRYLTLRLPTLHEYCAICDEPHTSPPMIQRTVCGREICCWQYSQFGKLISDAEGVNSSAEVTDLLVCMAIRAAKSKRLSLIFDPFPTLFMEGDSRPMMSPKTADRFEALGQVMRDVEEVRNETKHGGASWVMCADLLRQKSPLVRPMVQWISRSVRCLLLPLREERRIPEFRTEWQYLLVSAAPEREAHFQRLKQEMGSTFAFHGSPPENWHSILRNGLKVASNTSLMLFGARYGTGIYLSPRSDVSSRYSKAMAGKDVGARQVEEVCVQGVAPPRDLTGNRKLRVDNLRMLAVCEVVKDPSLKIEGDIWVAAREETVVTRFFLVYSGDELPAVNLSKGSVLAKLRGCVATCRDGRGERG